MSLDCCLETSDDSRCLLGLKGEGSEKMFLSICCSDFYRMVSVKIDGILLASDSWLEGSGPGCYYIYQRLFWAEKMPVSWQRAAGLDAAFGRGPEPCQVPEVMEVDLNTAVRILKRAHRAGQIVVPKGETDTFSGVCGKGIVFPNPISGILLKGRDFYVTNGGIEIAINVDESIIRQLATGRED